MQRTCWVSGEFWGGHSLVSESVRVRVKLKDCFGPENLMRQWRVLGWSLPGVRICWGYGFSTGYWLPHTRTYASRPFPVASNSIPISLTLKHLLSLSIDYCQSIVSDCLALSLPDRLLMPSG